MTDPKPPEPTTSGDGDAPENEVLRETRLLKEQADKAAAAEAAKAVAGSKAHSGGIGWRTAAGIGVGSAALMAALLYATRKRD